jgi:hypothetical protein
VGGHKLPPSLDFSKSIRGDDGFGDALTAYECVIHFRVGSDRCVAINLNFDVRQRLVKSNVVFFIS